MIHFNGPTTIHTAIDGPVGEMHLTVAPDAATVAQLQARVAELEAQLFEYEVEYGVCPMDLPDYSPNCARATVIAAARDACCYDFGSPAHRGALQRMDQAVRTFDAVDRAAWRATLLAYKARKEAPNG